MNSKIKKALVAGVSALALGVGMVAVTAAPSDAATHYSKSRVTKAEYRAIKKGMTLKKVRSIADSRGKHTWHYENTWTDTREECYPNDENDADAGEWCEDVEFEVTDRYDDYEWRSATKHGSVSISFEDGRVTSKSWWNW